MHQTRHAISFFILSRGFCTTIKILIDEFLNYGRREWFTL